MSLIAELRQALYDLPLAGKPDRRVIAHFCEHDGIRIRFTRARTTWHAMAPSAVKPWWITLEPLIGRQRRAKASTRPPRHGNDDGEQNDNKKHSAVEVHENVQ